MIKQSRSFKNHLNLLKKKTQRQHEVQSLFSWRWLQSTECLANFPILRKCFNKLLTDLQQCIKIIIIRFLCAKTISWSIILRMMLKSVWIMEMRCSEIKRKWKNWRPTISMTFTSQSELHTYYKVNQIWRVLKFFKIVLILLTEITKKLRFKEWFSIKATHITILQWGSFGSL